MANSPRWKVYDAQRQYQAATKDTVLAAVLVAFLGPGATIRDGHGLVVWLEGEDGLAAESYDAVTECCAQRPSH